MKLVVGLGNPGQKYKNTRHNIGFDVVAELARRNFADAPRLKYDAEYCEVRIGDEKTLLVAPQTFMNLSGRSVRQYVDFFQLEFESLVVVCDDMNLDCGQLRWRGKGSAGGQNGLKDIIRHLSSQDYPRLRVGIGRPPGRMQAADFVLSKFRDEEKDAVQHAIVTAADSIELWIKDGLAAAMNKYNVSKKKPKRKQTESKDTETGADNRPE